MVSAAASSIGILGGGSGEQESVGRAPRQPAGAREGGNVINGSIREAKLRPEFAALYPAIEPGVWMQASDIGRQLLLWHLTSASVPDAERVMSDEHFEFRGGHRRDMTSLEERTRAADLRRQA
jgi:hypothetical protein